MLAALALAAIATVARAPPAARAQGAGDTCPSSTKPLIQSDAAVIVGTPRSDEICGGPSANIIIGGALDDDIYGGGGNDTLIGGHGTDRLDGGSGNDWLRGGTNRDCYIGGDGADTVSFADLTPESASPLVGVTADLSAPDITTSSGTAPSCGGLAGPGRAEGQGTNEELAGVENITGSAFNDTLTAAPSGVNRLHAGWGDDTLNGKGGDDLFQDGDGLDTCTNDGATIACPEAQGHRPAGPFAAVVNDGREHGVVVLDAEGAANDTLTAEAPSSTQVRVTSSAALAPTSSCPAVSATELLCTAGGTVRYTALFGGDGNDTLTVGAGYTEQQTLDLNGGRNDDVLNGGGTAEVLLSGAGGSDQLYGNGGGDALISEGAEGADTLYGGDGDDQLVTDDVCSGHVMWGGPGTDIMGFARQTRYGVHATLGEGSTDAYAWGIDSSGNEISGCARTAIRGGGEILEGTNLGDELNGNENANTIWARRGDDTVQGRGGDDTIFGHAGLDWLYGGNGSDSLNARDGETDHEVNCGGDSDPGAIRDPEDPTAGCND